MRGIGAWPVIKRELRAESRNSSNYWTRVYAGMLCVLMFAGVMLLADRRGDSQSLGAVLFGNLQSILVSLIWLGAPLLTADCIARERRDGTLGLLFLTPLSPLGIALGKSLIHLFRSLGILLVAMPVLALPALMGGVTWKDGALALILDLSSLMLALSAGLLASTLVQGWARAVVVSLLLSFLFLLGFIAACGTEILIQALPLFPLGSGLDLSVLSLRMAIVFACGIAGISDAGGIWREAWIRFPAMLQDGLLAAATRNLLLSGLVAVAAVGIAAWQLRALRVAEANRPREGLVRGFLLQPLSPVRGARRRRRRIGRNPVLWLQAYSPQAGMARWGWCLLMLAVVPMPFWIVSVQGQALAPEDWLEWLLVPFGLLLAGVAFSSANSFRGDRETGAMELILVTPLKVAQIITGRLQGIWLQFLPALGVLALCIAYTAGSQHQPGEAVSFLCVIGSTFLTMPMIGMLMATLPTNWIACWVATFLLGMVSPLAPEAGMWCAGTAIDVMKSNQFNLNGETVRAMNDYWNLTQGRQFVRTMVMPFVSQWSIACLAGLGLHWRLKRRLYGQR